MVGWLVGCLGSEPRLALLQTGSMRRLLGEVAAPGGGTADRVPAFTLQLRKSHGKTCQGNRRALG